MVLDFTTSFSEVPECFPGNGFLSFGHSILFQRQRMENGEGQKRKWVTKEADTSLALKNSVCFSMNTIKALRWLTGPIKFQAVKANEIAQLVPEYMPYKSWNKINLTT